MQDIKQKLLLLGNMIYSNGCTESERQNDKALYEKVLEKHRFKDEDIKPKEVQKNWYTFKNKHERLLIEQIAAFVRNISRNNYWITKNHRNMSGFEFTQSQYEAKKFQLAVNAFLLLQ